ncbi:MAG: hypothetical protein M1339_02570, partial [Bacteroidetes bacterium]|nr:hypothetical protein [Bacteroidota bacterium]
GGVKVQESRMRENFMYGLRRGQGKRSDGRLERDTLLKEEKHLGSHDLYTTAPLSYSTTTSSFEQKSATLLDGPAGGRR